MNLYRSSARFLPPRRGWIDTIVAKLIFGPGQWFLQNDEWRWCSNPEHAHKVYMDVVR